MDALETQARHTQTHDSNARDRRARNEIRDWDHDLRQLPHVVFRQTNPTTNFVPGFASGPARQTGRRDGHTKESAQKTCTRERRAQEGTRDLDQDLTRNLPTVAWGFLLNKSNQKVSARICLPSGARDGTMRRARARKRTKHRQSRTPMISRKPTRTLKSYLAAGKNKSRTTERQRA